MRRDTFIGGTWSILYLSWVVEIEAAERGGFAAVTQQEDVVCITLQRGKLRTRERSYRSALASESRRRC